MFLARMPEVLPGRRGRPKPMDLRKQLAAEHATWAQLLVQQLQTLQTLRMLRTLPRAACDIIPLRLNCR